MAAKEEERRRPRRSKEAKAAAEREPKVVSTRRGRSRRASATKYAKDVVPALMKQFGYKNPNAGAAPREDRRQHGPRRGRRRTRRSSTPPSRRCAPITGQKPVVTRAKKAIATLQAPRGPSDRRDGHAARASACGSSSTASITLALPRVRDFRGVSPQGVRRQGQLHARPQGADHLPRDRLRQDRRHQGPQHLLRDDGARPTKRGARSSQQLGHAVPGS